MQDTQLVRPACLLSIYYHEKTSKNKTLTSQTVRLVAFGVVLFVAKKKTEDSFDK